MHTLVTGAPPQLRPAVHLILPFVHVSTLLNSAVGVRRALLGPTGADRELKPWCSAYTPAGVSSDIHPNKMPLRKRNSFHL